ncbi:MAG: Rieske (2Fe-2S) protein [Xanthobacteraceae bacterium]
MRDVNVGATSSFADPGRKLIESGGVEVGVFKLGNEFFAYENVCPHVGGPACQGKIIAKVEEGIAADRTATGMEFSKTKINVVCPWHGFEFDIRTGRHHGNARYRLKPIKVRVEGGDVIVTLPDEKKSQNTTVQPTQDGSSVRPAY